MKNTRQYRNRQYHVGTSSKLFHRNTKKVKITVLKIKMEKRMADNKNKESKKKKISQKMKEATANNTSSNAVESVKEDKEKTSGDEQKNVDIVYIKVLCDCKKLQNPYIVSEISKIGSKYIYLHPLEILQKEIKIDKSNLTSTSTKVSYGNVYFTIVFSRKESGNS